MSGEGIGQRYGLARAGERAGRAGAGAAVALARAALDVLVPPLSPLSPSLADGPGRIEASLWARLQLLAPPWCDTCGLPFPYDSGAGAVCGVCAARTPRYDRARSAVAYDEASRALILSFKHGGRRDALAHFAQWMAAAARDADADVVAPVPLHFLRLVKRRYNQAAVLGRAVAQRLELPFDAGLLVRRRRTETQAGKSGRGRRRNVAGAFAVPDEARQRLSGRRVLLVDDVMTTGATLEACARALKRAGAARVETVTLARVIKPGDPLR
jgi:ComF family protein